ncbi:MAG: anaerobic ribonucleoside-triphosphate reductase [Clostridiales bacterium]|nr:anaerobic ribonucleoside-triphosphate reductase [Clostridiales bacterium]
MENKIIEFPGEINYCPYCGNTELEVDGISITCNECRHDFTVMTHD